MTRPGRRSGDGKTREQILGAARASFAEEGFQGTTIRGVAARAGVDPALVHHYFGKKEELFVAAAELPYDVTQMVEPLLEGDIEELGERLVRTFLGMWDSKGPSPLVAMIRSATSNESAATMLREGVTHLILDRVARSLDKPDPNLRASLVGSQMIGLAFARYVVKVEPLASATQETLVKAIAPTVQRYLTGTL
jgi:AcrR family transcriptional regulator